MTDNAILHQVCRTNQRYCVDVWTYLLGQFRIQLVDRAFVDPGGQPHIIRELCTYRHDTMEQTVDMLHAAVDPEAACEGLAKPWNCEYHGGRIRLDNEANKADEMEIKNG